MDVLTQTKEFAQIHPEGLSVGSSVWFVSNTKVGGTATFAGAVSPAADVTLSVTKGNFNLFGSPFPVGLQLNNAAQISWANATGSDRTAKADQVWIWNPLTSDYEKWYLYADSTHKWDGWWDVLTQTKKFEDVHPNGLSAGTPMWYVAQGKLGETFDVKFFSPLAK